MSTYRKLPGLVEAKQVPDTSGTATSAELTEVALWSGGAAQVYIKAPQVAATLLRIPTLDGTLLAFAGDWIVKDGERFSVESEEQFAQSFVAAE